MTRFLRRLAATLLLALSAVAAVVPQAADPAWLKTARADGFARDGMYGVAIQLYREALILDPGNPEALFGLGRAFKAVGDYLVAEQYLNDTLAASDRMQVSAMRYPVNYELADLYRVQRRFSEYEQTLFHIIEMADAEPRPPRTLDVPSDTLQEVLSNSGIDRLLVLYRLEEDGATVARGQLCELLVGLGRYDSATEHGLVAIVQQVSTVIEAVIARDPVYTFRTVLGAVTDGQKYPEIRDYLVDSSLYRNLYFVGTALYSDGNSRLARSIWNLLVALPQAGVWADRAGIQLADPRMEPLLVPPD